MSFGRVWASARTLGSSCLHLVWPARCAACDAVLATDRAVFCDACGHGLLPLGPAACDGCALPRSVCPGCAGRRHLFSRALAAFEYGEVLAAAIVRMKHGDRPDLARRLGRLFRPTLRRALGTGDGGGAGGGGAVIDAVLPVPLHPRKLRRRGFNQALDLALAGRERSPTAPAVERRLLRRVKDTRELGRSGPAARREELAGAFAVADRGSRVRGRRFLVVDDVMTTGATLDGCAAALLDAGAAGVEVAVLARAVL